MIIAGMPLPYERYNATGDIDERAVIATYSTCLAVGDKVKFEGINR